MSAVEYFLQAPPIARTLAAGAFTMSVAVHTGLLPYHYIIFHPPFLMKIPPYFWSPLTSFLLTGDDFSVLFDTYMIYSHCAKLEKASPKFTKPGDFFTYIVFVMVTSLGMGYFLTGTSVYIHSLIIALLYTSSQDDRGQMTTYYIITIPSHWMPYLVLLMTWLTAGSTALIIGLCGLVAAHMHDFLTRLWPEFGGGRNVLPTPGFVRRAWETRTATVSHKGYGTAFARPQRSEDESSGSTSGPLPDSWKSRGSGHRLG